MSTTGDVGRELGDERAGRRRRRRPSRRCGRRARAASAASAQRVVVVLDDQHAAPAAPRGTASRLARRRRRRAVPPGSRTVNVAALPGPSLVRLDRAAVQLDEPAHQRQADAEPARARGRACARPGRTGRRRAAERRARCRCRCRCTAQHAPRRSRAHGRRRCVRPAGVYLSGVGRAGCRRPARCAPRRPSTQTVVEAQRRPRAWPRASRGGSACSTARGDQRRAGRPARARSTILPRVTRATSSRSSISARGAASGAR